MFSSPLLLISLLGLALPVSRADVLALDLASQGQLLSRTTNPDYMCANERVTVVDTLVNAVDSHAGNAPQRHPRESVKMTRPESSSQDASTSNCIQDFNSKTQYCLYTLSTFASDRGMSVVASPEDIQSILDVYAMNQLAQRTYPLPTDPSHFYEAALPGRGQGLVSNHTFHRGDLIMVARPVLILDESSFDTAVTDERLALQRKAIDNLPREAKDLFQALAGHWGGDEVEDRIITNAFGVGFGSEGKKFAVVVPEAARLNHDCRPNARFAFDPYTLTHKVHAIRTIFPGEELTISYLDEKQPYSTRQSYIHAHWGFKCSCNHCILPPPLREMSDLRVAAISALRTSLLDFTPNRGSTATPQLALRLIDFYRVEGLHSPLAEAYIFAALRYCIWEDEANTKHFAEKALRAWLMWEKKGGNKAMIEQLLKDPRKAWCWANGAQEQTEL
ncbi:SET [Glarea lozoyensis ATCC 20868]|uniref:SET n=1 Tax=Glarea lozoyensis (strain ATCC 20868 / MF5171) TaxID=1116229 RepID=S3CE99_GLAL2|nr:SET [Glarea lozoyensis ATCC 20868]EPE24310.1 SET [Glarea lozoyensis ATCC 20868]